MATTTKRETVISVWLDSTSGSEAKWIVSRDVMDGRETISTDTVSVLSTYQAALEAGLRLACRERRRLFGVGRYGNQACLYTPRTAADDQIVNAGDGQPFVTGTAY